MTRSLVLCEKFSASVWEIPSSDGVSFYVKLNVPELGGWYYYSFRSVHDLEQFFDLLDCDQWEF